MAFLILTGLKKIIAIINFLFSCEDITYRNCRLCAYKSAEYDKTFNYAYHFR